VRNGGERNRNERAMRPPAKTTKQTRKWEGKTNRESTFGREKVKGIQCPLIMISRLYKWNECGTDIKKEGYLR